MLWSALGVEWTKEHGVCSCEKASEMIFVGSVGTGKMEDVCGEDTGAEGAKLTHRVSNLRLHPVVSHSMREFPNISKTVTDLLVIEVSSLANTCTGRTDSYSDPTNYRPRLERTRMNFSKVDPAFVGIRNPFVH